MMSPGERDNLYKHVVSEKTAPLRLTPREADMVRVWQRERGFGMSRGRNNAIRDMIRAAFEQEFPGWTLPEAPIVPARARPKKRT